MIITRTPTRVSLAGGGTDLRPWATERGGAVIGFALAKYAYVSLRRLPPYHRHRHRIVWSEIELVDDVGRIRHPAVRAILGEAGLDGGVELHYDGDVPARSGMGTSSSFTVGLLHALAASRGRMMGKRELAEEAIRLEQEVMREAVGSQDQVFAAYGGLNRIDFDAGGFRVTPLTVTPTRRRALVDRLYLCFTGFQRFATEIEARKIASLGDRTEELLRVRALVDEVQAIICDPARDLLELGNVLHEGWELKRSLADGVGNGDLDAIYARATRAGAVGGKLLGAGGGGFFLFVVAPEDRPKLRDALADLIEVPVAIDPDGSRVIVYDPNGFE